MKLTKKSPKNYKQKFEQIGKAYYVLSNSKQKKLYDQLCLGILPLNTEKESGEDYHGDPYKVFDEFFTTSLKEEVS